MDATTQLANDMHFLTAPLRFIWRSILIFLLLFFAPLLYWTIPFACIAVDPNSDFRMLVFAYMALGPFVSAFWTMIVCMVRRYRRITSDGRPYQRSLGGVGHDGLAYRAWNPDSYVGSHGADVGPVLVRRQRHWSFGDGWGRWDQCHRPVLT